MEEDTHIQFRTTRWSLLDAMAAGGESGQRARGQLAETYWPAIYAYVRRTGRGREEAAEITQAFFGDVICGRQLFESAHREGGKLRALVLTALRRFLIDLHRRAEVRHSGFHLHEEQLQTIEADLGSQPAVAADATFEQVWARAALLESLRRCESHFCSIGKTGHWRAFEMRYLQPAIGAVAPPPYDSLCGTCGFRNSGDARSAVQTVRRRLASFLSEVLAEADDVGGLVTTARLLGHL